MGMIPPPPPRRTIPPPDWQNIGTLAPRTIYQGPALVEPPWGYTDPPHKDVWDRVVDWLIRRGWLQESV